MIFNHFLMQTYFKSLDAIMSIVFIDGDKHRSRRITLKIAICVLSFFVFPELFASYWTVKNGFLENVDSSIIIAAYAIWV